MGTTQDNHNNNAPVYQLEGLLYSEAGVPNLTNPTGARLVKETLSVTIYPLNDIRNIFKFGNYRPSFTSTGGITIKDNTNIYNLYVPNQSSPYFPGSTILTTDNSVKIKKYAETRIASGVASNKDTKKADIKEGYNFTDPLFDYYFVTDLNTLITNAEVQLSPANIGNLNQPSNANKIVLITGGVHLNNNWNINTGTQVQPKIIIINGDLQINGKNNDLTIGSDGLPTVLIVNGDIKINGSKENSFEVHGLLYVKGDFTTNGSYCKDDDSNAGGGGGDYCKWHCEWKHSKKHDWLRKWNCDWKCYDKDSQKPYFNDGTNQVKCANNIGCHDNSDDDGDDDSDDDKHDDECDEQTKTLIRGSLAVEGTVDFEGNVIVDLEPGYIARLRLINEYLTYIFHNVPYHTKEMFN